MGATKDQYLTKIPQATRNMKDSILEEPLIHLSIWIRNDAIMNVEDDEAEGSRMSLPMNCHFMILFCYGFVYIQLMLYA